jgi:hypothetical protein
MTFKHVLTYRANQQAAELYAHDPLPASTSGTMLRIAGIGLRLFSIG